MALTDHAAMHDGIVAEPTKPPRPPIFRRVGGLIHWRIGRLGGSFYWAKSKQPVDPEVKAALKADLTARRRQTRLQASAWRRYCLRNERDRWTVWP